MRKTLVRYHDWFLTAGAGVVILLLFGVLALSGSQPVGRLDNSHVHHRPGSIVGAETPSLIPDGVAYAQVLNTLAAIHDLPNGEARLKSYFRHIEATVSAVTGTRVHLTSADQGSLVATAIGLRAATQRSLATSGMSKDEARKQAIQNAVAVLSSNLSSEGAELVRQFVVSGVKPKMKLLR